MCVIVYVRAMYHLYTIPDDETVMVDWVNEWLDSSKNYHKISIEQRSKRARFSTI